MKQLVIGSGEIGRAVYENLKSVWNDEVYIRDIEPVDIPVQIEVLHIAIGYSDKFVEIVEAYKKEYGVNIVFIYSTVPIGTCRKLKAVHSPVEGRHPHLQESIQKMIRWVATDDRPSGIMAFNIWMPIVGAGRVKLVNDSRHTEFLKMSSTSLYGINIAFAEYRKSVCDDLDMDFELVKEFDQHYNDLYQDIGLPQFQRYILDAPTGVIGGHCVVPNAELLNEQYPSDLLVRIGQVGHNNK